ncbi:MAG: hypothetical protein COU09_02565 [Candidatus Harrisonbacteria bacterium CG10_big_fil_rev_8_21_14_0_10_44_23]|uniref:Uncharacterized protein n=1 Tax=Candidatus Harrisonbacteria bacterium CG10_big_fil_rev_8_21_14_0_10_44_23 TaxID=1974585 RepID=A0A2H0UPT1_9BACT|nr:MAG: hypothetical protein COU09_02565 [Candidatus Harrisonbacteria bacterium CG10_big_fil_rev_8_21_14_0_10_44_23]
MKKKRKWLSNTLFIILLVIAGVILISLLGYFLLTKDLPNLEAIGQHRVIESTKIFDREEETLLYELYEEEKRTVVPFDKIPEKVKQATIAIEDQNFYAHNAIDIRGIIRAVLVNLRSGKKTQGASTITQQLARNTFLSLEKTWTRKVRELILAFRLEKQFSKDEILHLYLNQIPYGSNAYGIESASRTYFQKPVEELNLAETALLASLPQAPSYYSPWGSHVEDLMDRKNLVLEQMYHLGYISEQEKTNAQEDVLEIKQPDGFIKAPHFSITVSEYLNEKYGEDFVRRAGLKIITTLDWPLQEIAEKVVKEGVERNTELYNGTNGALLAQDTDTGQILAMVGSKDYFDRESEGNFNVATQGLRQPGSAMKPFVYLTALKKGFTTETVVFDTETEFDASGSGSYKPHNFDNIFRGPVTFRTALAQSINVPAVKALYLAGVNDVLSLMKDFGVNTLTEKSRYGLSLVLGGGEITLEELVGAYSTLAEEGTYHPQSMILRVEDSSGNILEEYEDRPTQVISPEYPRMINDILTDRDARAGLFQSSFHLTVFSGHDVALKTGTTNDYRDAWAFGYTPNFAVGVWAGNNNNTPMTAQGSSLLAAVPMWNAFLKDALKTRDPEVFPKATQEFPEKPMLKGEHIVYYENNGDSYPQVHNLLYYVNKNDPPGPEPRRAIDGQYQNWETSVLAWAKNNIPNFNQFNQPLPLGSTVIASGGAAGQANSVVKITQPKKGAGVDRSFIIRALITMPSDISSIVTLFNGIVIDTTIGPLKSPYNHDARVSVSQIKTQNKITVIAQDERGNSYQDEIIVFEKD